MKQLLSVILLAVLFTGFINAQSQGISIGANLALPIGDWSNSSSVGFGGTATYERSFTPNVVGQVYSGYIMMGGKDFEGGSYSSALIPIMVGAKYFFQPGLKGFYGNALIGVTMYSFSASYDDPEVQAYWDLYSPSTTSTEFSFGIGAGYEIPMGKNAVDLNAHFMLVSDANYIGARIAYRFGL
jgi:hypothetical protein